MAFPLDLLIGPCEEVRIAVFVNTGEMRLDSQMIFRMGFGS